MDQDASLSALIPGIQFAKQHDEFFLPFWQAGIKHAQGKLTQYAGFLVNDPKGGYGELDVVDKKSVKDVWDAKGVGAKFCMDKLKYVNMSGHWG